MYNHIKKFSPLVAHYHLTFENFYDFIPVVYLEMFQSEYAIFVYLKLNLNYLK